METMNRSIRDGIVIEKVNLIRATMNEAFEIKEILNEDIFDYKKIIVDLSSCDYVDSTFLGALVFSYRRLKEKNGTLVLVVNHGFLAKSFLYSDIASIFQVYYSVREAIEGLTEKNNEESATD
jgi:anti-anti-sigma factor